MASRVPSDDDVRAVLREMASIEDLGLLVLKAHALAEWALRRVLASRLRVNEDQLPDRIPYSLLVELALTGLDSAGPLSRHLGWLAQVRNEYAHQLRPDDRTRRLPALVQDVAGQAWPAGDQAQQVALLRRVGDTLLVALLELHFGLHMSPEDWAALEAGLEERARSTVERLSDEPSRHAEFNNEMHLTTGLANDRPPGRR